MANTVGLLTLPLHTNYGGILQIAALYQFLAANGKQPVLLRNERARPMHHLLADSILRRIPGQDIRRARSNEKARALHYPFINSFMPTKTAKLRTSSDFRKATTRYNLDAVIVGSDQVWRFEYHGDQKWMTYFLDFIDPSVVRGISYAASFGLSDWSYPDQTKRAGQLLSYFHAVSVRENSGAAICRDTLGRGDCVVTLDPTLLVDAAFYDRAIARHPVYTGRKIVSYILDQSSIVQKTERAVREALGQGLEAFSLRSSSGEKRFDIPEWLRAIRDAEFVITDSFHGTVFCIIFQKNFIAIPNAGRGRDRFTSLLENLRLLDRLFVSQNVDEIESIVKRPVDFSHALQRLAELRKQSAHFLLAALE